ncbi:MAG: diphthamide biosynthesis enzyme Dph2 [Candidatus Aenigmatarchaeota archaeon]
MFDELIKTIKKQKPKKILLQLPDGLKTRAIDILNEIENEKIDVILSNDTCYGACDLREREAKMLGCDLIVHIGHNKFYKNIKTKIPVIYYPGKIDTGLNNIDFSKIKENKLGLITTIQYINLLKDVAELLKKENKKPIIGGQILGCWIENAKKIANKVDAFLFIGTGKFHSLGIVGKKVYVLDLEKQNIEVADTTIFEKRRYANIFKAKDAKVFGIIVSSKLGQYNIQKAEKIKKIIEKNHKKAFILIMDEIKDEKLLGLHFDAYINTACPRIIDDKFSKPIINDKDIKELFL